MNRDCQAKNPEKYAEKKKQYYQKHYDKALERARDYYWRDPDKQCRRTQAWRAANKDKVQAYERNRRAKRRVAQEATGGNLEALDLPIDQLSDSGPHGTEDSSARDS